MEILDMQIHPPRIRGEWYEALPLASRREVDHALLEESLQAVGVHAAVLNPLDDPDFALSLAERYPQRFSVGLMLFSQVGQPVRGVLSTPDDPHLESKLDKALAPPGVSCLRIILTPRWSPAIAMAHDQGRLDGVLDACEKRGTPVMVLATDRLDAVAAMAAAHPDLPLMVDHLGVPQAPLQELDAPAWRALPELLECARFPNVSVKLCGAPAMSQLAYPFEDTWPYVEQVLERYGRERVAWASDMTRFRGDLGWPPPPGGRSAPGCHTYLESLASVLHSDRLSTLDKEWLLGRSARKFLGWPGDTTQRGPLHGVD